MRDHHHLPVSTPRRDDVWLLLVEHVVHLSLLASLLRSLC